MAQLELNKRTVYVPVVHLTSDRQESCSTKRAHQLNVVFDRTCPAAGDDSGNVHLATLPPSSPLTHLLYVQTDYAMDCFLMGDFNFGDDDNDGAIRKDFVDAWLALRPDDVGYVILTLWLPS